MGKEDETLPTTSDRPVKKPDEPPTAPPLLGQDSLGTTNTNENARKDESPALPKASETIGRTIQELERLLAEAVKLAEAAGAMEHVVGSEKTGLERPMNTTRRTSEDLAITMNKHLEAAATEPTKAPVRNGAAWPLRRRETGVGPTDIDTPDNTSPLDGTIRLLPRDPTAEKPDERKGGLSKNPGTSSEESTAHKKKSVTIVEPPRTNRRSSPFDVPRGKRKHNQSLERPVPPPVPALQLNDVELKDVNAEEKDGMLRSPGMLEVPRPGHERHFTQMFGINSRQGSMLMAHADEGGICKIDLNGARHIDVAEKPDDLDVHKTCHHAPVARNWPDSRKRFAALISCINTACLGLIIGIYAGEVPAIQYVVVDLNREMILGNVFLYCGLVFPTLVCWPLPLLHGRKPYTVVALTVALCLQIPQGLMVISFRSPDVARYRVILLLARGLSGFIFGFANMNNLGTLLDVFGASLSSSKAHENLASPSDVRRHGGGMGVWLAAWS